MIRVSAELFDISGSFNIQPLKSSVMTPLSRRVTRTATLDAGVAITDRGYSEGDRTMVLRFKPVSQAHDDIARRLVRLHPTVRVCDREGVFRAAPQQFEPAPGENRLTLLIIEKISED